MVVANLLWSAKHGRKAGNDPWKANTLEWFTQSPPPPNNFDVIPRVRSLEPMKDIRREVLAEIQARRDRRAAACAAERLTAQTLARPDEAWVAPSLVSMQASSSW